MSATSKHVHRYQARCSWKGTTGGGYEKYDRTHLASAPPASPTLILSADPAFRGEASRLNPEQLVIIAASSCQLLSFLAVASRARVEILEYDDEAEAEMPEGDLPVRITRIRLKPRIVIGPNNQEERIRQLVEIAHNECYVANSLKCQISVEPTIEVRNK